MSEIEQLQDLVRWAFDWTTLTLDRHGNWTVDDDGILYPADPPPWPELLKSLGVM